MKEKDAQGEVAALCVGESKLVWVFEIDSRLYAQGQLEPNTILTRVLPPPADMGDQKLAKRMHEITELLRLRGPHSKHAIGQNVTRGELTNRALATLVKHKYVSMQGRLGKKGSQTHDYVLRASYEPLQAGAAAPSNPDWGGGDYD